ncbi:L-serine ammonia-lyase [Sessilibacter corallicola]|uniref:L-serine dehydratase n=1 Tax=Sessilibacter corallicola TaxID=2904075 RepID=A0ABQ0AEF7_9GAMM
MPISTFDLFKIGIGPSSSHTVGPMRAAYSFAQALIAKNLINHVERIQVELFGSLGATGRGHGSPKAVILGLMGFEPETVNIELIPQYIEHSRQQKQLLIANLKQISFDEKNDLILHKNATLPEHTNGMRFQAWGRHSEVVLEKVYYSVGGGFILDDSATDKNIIIEDKTRLPFPFTTCAELLAICKEHCLSFSDVMLKNELTWHSEQEISDRLLQLWSVMQECVSNGIEHEGELPGGLKVKRRAHKLHQKLTLNPEASLTDPLIITDWVTLYALAVNEENAAGGRVVTAPTNGAAGIIPAVLHYFHRFCPQANNESIQRFLLTAAAIGILYKENASISGAEVGCQGEVGSACSMAAGALTEVLGGNIHQVENAAEIAMEHNLGLTCDPIGGLVQIPCIERNAMAAIKAISASRMALRGDGSHFVSLDKVIKTMRETGRDMHLKYKETARGGLAMNVIEVPVNIVDC